MKHGPLQFLLTLGLLVAHACGAAAAVTPPTQAETLQLLNAEKFAELDQRFSAVQSAYRKGSISDEDLRAAFRVFYDTDARLELKYDRWVVRHSKSYVANLARGIYFKRLGQDRRGKEVISKTSSAQVGGMQEAFKEADASLEASMRLDAKPLLSYLHAMDLRSFLGSRRETREILDRAVEIDPGNIIVREKFMGTLRPRWGGSMGEMSAFVEESRKAGLAPTKVRMLQAMVAEERGYQLLYKEKENAAGLAAFREAVALGHLECKACFADALMRSDKYDEAIKVYDEILLENPKNADALRWRGLSYLKTRKLAEAFADTQAAAALGDAIGQNQLGVLYMQGVPGVIEPDAAVATEWFRKSAAQGNEMGSKNLKKALTVKPPLPARANPYSVKQ